MTTCEHCEALLSELRQHGRIVTASATAPYGKCKCKCHDVHREWAHRLPAGDRV